MVNNMQVNIFTLFWLAIGSLSILGLYFFNQGRSLLVFITARKYLLLFLVAALFGMRQKYEIAFLVAGISLFLMWLDYKPYLQTCRRLKNLQEQKH